MKQDDLTIQQGLDFKPIENYGVRADLRKIAERGRETYFIPFKKVKINPGYNGRITSLMTGIDELIASLESDGLQEPLLVDWDHKNTAWVDKGHRRFTALTILNERGLLKKINKGGLRNGLVECFVNHKPVELIDKLCSQYTGNNLGVPFNDQEIAMLCRRLTNAPFHQKPDQIAHRLKLSRGSINNYLLLAGCSQDTFDAIEQGVTTTTAVVTAIRVLKSPDQVDEEIRKRKSNNKKFTVGDANLLKQQSEEAEQEMNPTLEGLGGDDNNDSGWKPVEEGTPMEETPGNLQQQADQAFAPQVTMTEHERLVLRDEAIDMFYKSKDATEWLQQQSDVVRALYTVLHAEYVSSSKMTAGVMFYCVNPSMPVMVSKVVGADVYTKKHGQDSQLDFINRRYVTEDAYKYYGENNLAVKYAEGFGYLNMEHVSQYLTPAQLKIYTELSFGILRSFTPGSAIRLHDRRCTFISFDKDSGKISGEIIESAFVHSHDQREVGEKIEADTFRLQEGDYAFGPIWDALLVPVNNDWRPIEEDDDTNAPEVKAHPGEVKEFKKNTPKKTDDIKFDKTREEIVLCNNLIGNLDKIDTMMGRFNLNEQDSSDVRRLIGFCHTDLANLRIWVHKNAKS